MPPELTTEERSLRNLTETRSASGADKALAARRMNRPCRDGFRPRRVGFFAPCSPYCKFLRWGTRESSGAVIVRQPRRECRTGHAFSLVELVIVVVIIGVIASIAVPRMSSAAANAEANALEATLAGVRKAIDLYYAEHGKYPGYAPATGLRNDENFVKQLLMYTDESGNMNAAPSTTFRFGPYLRKPFPKNPTNGLSTVFVKAAPGEATPAADTCGWGCGAFARLLRYQCDRDGTEEDRRRGSDRRFCDAGRRG